MVVTGERANCHKNSLITAILELSPRCPWKRRHGLARLETPTMVPGHEIKRQKIHRDTPVPKSTLADSRIAIWDRSGQCTGHSLFGTGLGAVCVAKLLAGEIYSATRASYQSHWDTTYSYYIRAQRMPASGLILHNVSVIGIIV